ncbi:hypothetical protein IFM89_029076 [Coptis chinensis]|uniref:Homeobox domain-containing protein n=1 Tax=Coptis chinensis TaxID=261450 RepID=A0A835M277_9MAGN|nr:hypothetical protein IFM89_029076 [Coptis chinensis]
MEEDDECNIELGLGLGRSESVDSVPMNGEPVENKKRVPFHLLFPPCKKEDVDNEVPNFDGSDSRTDEQVEHNNNSIFVYSNSSSKNDDNNATRKKLVLTSEQVMLLEENFKQHRILSPVYSIFYIYAYVNFTIPALNKKRDLAEQLNLQARQIEVWFQNRRARTKQKQREKDCEFWKSYCQSLQDENRRLNIELQDLRSRKLGSSSLYVHLPLSI